MRNLPLAQMHDMDLRRLKQMIGIVVSVLL